MKSAAILIVGLTLGAGTVLLYGSQVFTAPVPLKPLQAPETPRRNFPSQSWATTKDLRVRLAVATNGRIYGIVTDNVEVGRVWYDGWTVVRWGEEGITISWEDNQ